jgi:hypothetical protein
MQRHFTRPIVTEFFHEIATLAQRRDDFHRHLSFRTPEEMLDSELLRALSVDFGNPPRSFATHEVEIESDCDFFVR